jgi:hypothetical protein
MSEEKESIVRPEDLLKAEFKVVQDLPAVESPTTIVQPELPNKEEEQIPISFNQETNKEEPAESEN